MDRAFAAEWLELDATEQAAHLRRGEVTAAEAVEAAVVQIEALNPRINAVIAPLFEKARAAAAGALPAGPFGGVPILLKDLMLQTAGDPYHAGMRFLKERGHVAGADSYHAQKLRCAGFIFLGKTNVPELGPVVATEPEAYGPTRNPWHLEHSTGGSSGGSAAAVAARMVAIAHGNDGGGSIRVPASACGLVGLKPSRGRTSFGPEYGEAMGGLAVELGLTRSVRDCAGLLDAVAGPMPGDPYQAPIPSRPYLDEVGADVGRLRIGLLPEAPDTRFPTHPECARAAVQTGELLTSLGHEVELSHPKTLEDPRLLKCLSTLTFVGVAHDLDAWGRVYGTEIGPGDVERYTWTIATIGRRRSGSDYLEALETAHRLGRAIAGWWEEGFDLLLTPTLNGLPPRIGAFEATESDPLLPGRRTAELTTFVFPYNLTGQPAISLPLHQSDNGLPIGVQLVARYGGEDVLLRVAAQLEAAAPWRARRPPLRGSS